MRIFLFLTILFLVVVVAGIVIGATVCGRPELMLMVIVPAMPILPLLLVYLLLAAYTASKERHQGMRDAAERLGFLYTADVSSALLEESAASIRSLDRRNLPTRYEVSKTMLPLSCLHVLSDSSIGITDIRQRLCCHCTPSMFRISF